MTTRAPTPRWIRKLEAVGACTDAVEWARTQDDFASAWAKCVRGDWMMWIAAKCAGKRGSKAHRSVVLASCACARLSLPHVRAGENRPLKTIDLAERWANGDDSISIADLRYAADAADAAAAYDAADDAAAAYAAAGAAAGAAARNKTLARCAGIVREMVEIPKIGSKR